MKTTKFTRRQVLVSAASGLAVSMLAPSLLTQQVKLCLM